ncbi:hypothetical protein D3C87_1894250 [compost metagenome]
MVIVYTNLGVTPLPLLVLINSVMFVGIFSRMIPSQTLMSAIPSPANRGSFMSISASLQQLAGGVGSIVAGMIVVQQADGMIRHFDIVGYVMLVLGIISLGMMYFINRSVQQKKA